MTSIYSVFLFHELPKEVRQKVIEESFRVSKSDGWMVILDSIQLDDVKDLNWALTDFPKNFHEPFFKNYTENPMEQLMDHFDQASSHTEIGFLSKAIVLQKPEDLMSSSAN